MDLNDPGAAVAWLRTPQAVRECCARLAARVESGDSPHFALAPERLAPAADYVLDVIRANYPDLAVPYHSRWRHFAAGGRNRWGELVAGLDLPAAELGRIRTELTLVSVLLDAGAGPEWRYRDRDGRVYRRSEGLAVASFAMYAHGLFSARPGAPLRVDATALAALDARRLGSAFQVGPGNELAGLAGRLDLLRRLGAVIRDRPECFGPHGRLGGLFDHLAGQAGGGALPATDLLAVLLDLLAPIWPGRITLAGANLGDVWRHPTLRTGDLTDGLVPFHKLSQWLAYSLVEPLEDAGLAVTGLDALTGLPEYRNGGLFVDLGVLVPRDPSLLARTQPVDAEAVVEWRALTVVLLDRLAARVRERLGLDAARLPLARVLEGGTWVAGRRVARERRADGSPPIAIVSDGTVF
ncbi:MAG: URC4/urg3 family protein [Candidatus Competibacterales bacterium]|nr:URC4/urg3 family protein [Candidatus Competibacterales bacterium]